MIVESSFRREARNLCRTYASGLNVHKDFSLRVEMTGVTQNDDLMFLVLRNSRIDCDKTERYFRAFSKSQLQF